jgi:hypothetical protein
LFQEARRAPKLAQQRVPGDGGADAPPRLNPSVIFFATIPVSSSLMGTLKNGFVATPFVVQEMLSRHYQPGLW